MPRRISARNRCVLSPSFAARYGASIVALPSWTVIMHGGSTDTGDKDPCRLGEKMLSTAKPSIWSSRSSNAASRTGFDIEVISYDLRGFDERSDRRQAGLSYSFQPFAALNVSLVNCEHVLQVSAEPIVPNPRQDPLELPDNPSLSATEQRDALGKILQSEQLAVEHSSLPARCSAEARDVPGQHRTEARLIEADVPQHAGIRRIGTFARDLYEPPGARTLAFEQLVQQRDHYRRTQVSEISRIDLMPETWRRSKLGPIRMAQVKRIARRECRFEGLVELFVHAGGRRRTAAVRARIENSPMIQ